MPVPPKGQFSARFLTSQRLELRQGNTLLAGNVYDLRFHDDGPDSSLSKLCRRVVEPIMR